MSTAPIIATYDGEAFAPLPRFAKQCDREFVIGERYRIDIVEERSAKSHNHFFAELKQIWDSLPDQIAEEFPSVEHMRKFALIRTGFFERRSHVAGSRAEALRLAAFVRPGEEFAIIETEGATVTVLTAQSQSLRAMGKEAFQRSKDAVLAYCYDLVGVDPVQMADRRRAA